MKLTINYVSANRQLGKAMRRVRPRLQSLLDARAGEHPAKPYADVVLWISDAPPDHYKEVRPAQPFLSVHVGYPPELTFRPSDDDQLFGALIHQIELFVRNSAMGADEKAHILSVVSGWAKDRLQ